ncbi:hypothetical protein [Haloferax sulfurifontis]|uniref:hypothetical protein n=1 Tax=Haloferax sulfurifontis TaxID=255616 RepID=UPI0016637486|nr:hypothetical protein [Haloferax sulfurifontis]
MRSKTMMKTAVTSTVGLVTILGVLTALREWNAEPPTAIQSVLVFAGILILVSISAYKSSQGSSFSTIWLLVMGPCLGFSINLFVPVVAEITLFSILAPLATGIVGATIIAGTGVLVNGGLQKTGLIPNAH